MALSSTTYRVAFAGNGSTTAFSFPYYFLLNADLVVILRVDSTGVETTKTITTHYTISGAGNPSGGTVTMVTAPATGETLIVYRDPAITQGLDIVANDSLPADDLEESLDRLTMIAQRLDGRMDRAVTLSEGTTDPFTATLPALLTDNPGATIVVNDAGDGWDVGPTADEITAAAGYATAAAASASASAASAVLSDASADAALVSETAAAASAASAAAQLASAFFRDVVYITSADSPVTIASGDNGKLYNINSSGGAISFTLPTIASTTLPFNIAFKLTTAGNTVTINRASTDTIEGATSVTMATAGQGLQLVADADGSPDNWSSIAMAGTVLPIVNGGTNATTKSGAFDSLSPMTTGGDLIYGGSSGTGTRLANSSQSSGTFLKSNGGTSAPTWEAVTCIAPPTIQKFTSGSGTYNKNYTFLISSGSATVGATYTNNAVTFTVYATVASSNTVVMSGSGAPSSSGTLTKASGTGDSTLTFSQALAPFYLRVRMVGGGGGGGGSGTASQGNGAAGGNTTFGSSLLVANGGSATGGPGWSGGNGGTASLGTGPIGIALSGGNGPMAFYDRSAEDFAGSSGAVTPFGGAGSGAGQSGVGGSNAVTNTGSGGGGGGFTNVANCYAGAGGAAGGYVDAIISSPSATYAYAVGAAGAGGTAGTSGQAGTNGGSGIIIVEEHYQ